ncbi:DNA methyltransferase [Paraburkholderia youngii]|uniref:DNA methyltransferase n=1 Tax=Paraburkholderia youngii TaxID=2782701 RepID=UPI003D1F58F5
MTILRHGDAPDQMVRGVQPQSRLERFGETSPHPSPTGPNSFTPPLQADKELFMNRQPRKYRQAQYVLPLLDCLENGGGSATTRDLYTAIALKLDVPEEERNAREVIGGQNIKTFDHAVRWAQQQAKARHLIAPKGKGVWELLGKGKDALHTAAPGVVITLFTTEQGVAMFGRVEEAASYIDDGSVQLFFTSPPYPLLREKAYKNHSASTYLDWFVRIAEKVGPKITEDGSVAFNLGDVFEAGAPFVSTYQERLIIRLEDDLGWKLCQKWYWNSPTKLPAPAQWVTIERSRVKPSVEQIYWMAPKGKPYADNRGILVPYSDSMRARLDAGGEKAQLRPSGHAIAEGGFSKDNGGAIPGNLITASNTVSNDQYQRSCRERGLPIHPARFPDALPETMINFLTRKNDVVWDGFCGSTKTGDVAERLGRRWICNDMTLDYLMGGTSFFPNAQMHEPDLLARGGQQSCLLDA